MFWGIDLSSSHTQDKFYSVRHGQPACGRCYGRVELLCEGPSCLSGALDTISSLSLKDNNHDNYCVAVMKGYTVVGHVPRPASNVCFHFLGRGGHRGFCKVTGSHLNQGVNVGLEIPGLHLSLQLLWQLKICSTIITTVSCWSLAGSLIFSWGAWGLLAVGR